MISFHPWTASSAAAGPTGQMLIIVLKSQLPGLHGFPGRGHKLLHTENTVGRPQSRSLQFVGFNWRNFDSVQMRLF